MRYISTRGQAPILSFSEVAVSGLASDGGLYVPESFPSVDETTLRQWQQLSYQELALEVMRPFVDGEIDDDTLAALIKKSYSTFRHPDIAPLIPLEEGHYVLELFHGPTLAFKDFALQFLGNMLEHLLEKQNKRVVIIGATSGDTGSAAIEGCLGCERITLFMLHPFNRVSDVQRRQMTTVLADNIFNLAIGAPKPGNFDDCQDMVKHMFRHPEFMNGIPLTAVNSINWVRIMAQIVYYFYAALKLGAPEKKISFSVPTGNFGDIFAGYIAKKMGLPIDKLIVATNRNDILDRFFKTNDYSKQGVHPTVSPSMDIQISSNFERLLFDLYQQDAEAIHALMERFNQEGTLAVTPEVLEKAKAQFGSMASDDDAIREVVREVHIAHNYVADPHTATGIRAARKYMQDDIPMVTLATAHPAKFPDVTEEAMGKRPALPEHLHDLFEREEKVYPLKNDLEAVQHFIQTHCKA